MAAATPWRLFVLPAAIVPIPLVLRAIGAPDVAVFAAAGLAVVPLAHLMGLATEDLGRRAGPGIGGLLNATLGNATELIIAVAALLGAAAAARRGDTGTADSLVAIVKASISGSIIGNILLVLGVSMLVGGLRHKTQKFSAPAAMLQVTMLSIAIASLVMPELFQISYGASAQLPNLSAWIAVLLLVGYVLGLVFSLHTHKDVFNPEADVREKPAWSKGFSLGVLLGSTVLVAVESELLVGAVEGARQSLGLTEIFLGVIVIAIIGNAAEHGAAVLMAWKDKMDLAVGIATISSTQIALFVTPVLVLASLAFGRPLTLAFEGFELVALILSVAIAGLIAKDGESNWYEGALLLILYGIIAVGFYFHP